MRDEYRLIIVKNGTTMFDGKCNALAYSATYEGTNGLIRLVVDAAEFCERRDVPMKKKATKKATKKAKKSAKK